MATKKTGISRDLLTHPGEIIADILEDRDITQADLAKRTGVSPTHVSNVISGQKGISADYAQKLEYALGVPKSFWINLQANYESELLELNEKNSVSEDEKSVVKALRDVIKYLRSKGKLPIATKAEDTVIELRKLLQISNIANLGDLAGCGEFRRANTARVDPYVLGAWLRLCQISASSTIDTSFSLEMLPSLVDELKQIMLSAGDSMQIDLENVFAKYGIDFSIVHNFRGAPVQGYISEKSDGRYQMVLTIRGAYADIFWFTLFHEIGHIVNGDVNRSRSLIDTSKDEQAEKEKAADRYARDTLLSPESYADFRAKGSCNDIRNIIRYAESQGVPPYIVIGRLQKEKVFGYEKFKDYKTRYKWVE